MKVFLSKEILLQHSVLNYRIDLYFPKHRLAIEVDKKDTKTEMNAKKFNKKRV